MRSLIGTLLLAGSASCGGVSTEADAAPNNNIAFVTSQTFPVATIGDGVSADAKCQAAAQAASLPGTYRAYLTYSTEPAPLRLSGARGWVRTDGRPFVDQVTDLIAGRIIFPLQLDEHGVDLTGTATLVATGTTATGTANGNNCGDWAMNTGLGASGQPTFSNGGWAFWAYANCAIDSAHLYCFAIDKTEPVTIPNVANGRWAFVTEGKWFPYNGIAAADTLCQTEATNAGRTTGTYLAALATSTASAASRMNLDGAPWVRPDEVPLVSAGRTPFDGDALDVGIGFNAAGDPVYPDTVVTGSGTADLPGAITYTCTDWAASDMSLIYTYSGSTATPWFGVAPTPCTTDRRLYCFEQ